MEDEGTLSYKDSISRLGKNAWYTRECVKKGKMQFQNQKHVFYKLLYKSRLWKIALFLHRSKS